MPSALSLLLPSADCVRLALGTWYVPCDALFGPHGALRRGGGGEGASSSPLLLAEISYSILHGTQYIVVCYGATRLLLWAFPSMRLLEMKRGDGGSNRMLTRAKLVPAAILSCVVRSVSMSVAGRCVERAMRLGAAVGATANIGGSANANALGAFDVFGRALRGLHNAGMRCLFKSPAAVSEAIRTLWASKPILSPSPEGGSLPSAFGCCMPRVPICSMLTDAYMGRFLRLIQPFGSFNAFRMCDSKADPYAMGVEYNGQPRLSSTAVTVNSFDRFGLVAQDAAAVLVAYAATEFVASFFQYGVFSVLSPNSYDDEGGGGGAASSVRRKWEWCFERHFVLLCIRVALVIGIANPLANKVLGPTSTSIGLFGIARVPTAVVAHLFFAAVDGRLSRTLLAWYVRTKAHAVSAWACGALAGGERGSSRSPSHPADSQLADYSDLRAQISRARYVRRFESIVGVPYESLTAAEIVAIRTFVATQYIDGDAGSPHMVGTLHGLAALYFAIVSLELEDDYAVAGQQQQQQRRIVRTLAAKSTVVLERALRAGTLRRINPSGGSLAALVSPASPHSIPSASSSKPRASAASYSSLLDLDSTDGEDADADADDDPCAVCLVQLTRRTDDMAIGAACGHAFHTACIRDCLAVNSDCPICRRRLVEPIYIVPTGREPFAGEGGGEGAHGYNASGIALLESAMRYSASRGGGPHWGFNHDAVLNHLVNRAAAGSQDALDQMVMMRVLDDDYDRRLHEDIMRVVPPRRRVVAEVAQIALASLQCPIYGPVEPSGENE